MDKQKHFYLFRGLIREALHWHDFPDHLLRLFPGSKITTIDIPGAGEYLNIASPLSVSKMVEIMHQKFRSSRLPQEESILVAVSLGGMIASSWMKKFPHDFNKAIFINTSFGDFSPIYHRLLPSALIHLMKVPLLKGRAKEEHILKLVTNNHERFNETLDLWEKIQNTRPVAPANTLRQLIAGASFTVSEFTPQIPVFLLGSTQDRMVSIECSRSIAKKWNVPLTEHPQGGHDLTSDYPEWVAEKIKVYVS